MSRSRTTSPRRSPTPPEAATSIAPPAGSHLRLLPPPEPWAGEVALASVDALTPHPLASRLPAMTDTERAALRADITSHGITTPIEATPDGVILDGHARWRVARELGRAGVPVRTVDPDDHAAFILTRAVGRKNLSASQRAALAVECDEYRRGLVAGNARRLANQRPDPDVATLPHRGARTRERAAVLAGVSAHTIQDAACVREADPELFGEVLAGRIPVDKAARRIRREQRYAAIAPAPPMPDGPFALILADPPWRMGAPDSPSAPENHYPTMSVAEISALEIPAAETCVLFLWAVNSMLPEALEVMGTWGFTYRTNLCWTKPSIGPGNWARHRHELLVVGTRGDIRTPREEDRPDSVIEAPRGRHSEKPEEAYVRIERAYPQLSKCELFARGRPRLGWVAWGNEVVTQ
jgi:N6-adenosine-specific RNA methylase IME4